jgi:hypothetical protein
MLQWGIKIGIVHYRLQRRFKVGAVDYSADFTSVGYSLDSKLPLSATAVIVLLFSLYFLEKY